MSSAKFENRSEFHFTSRIIITWAYTELCHRDLQLNTARATAVEGTQAHAKLWKTCTQALSRGSARPPLTRPTFIWSRNWWTVDLRRRSRRSRRRGRVSSGFLLLAAAAALHREEAGEAEHEEVEGAHHLLGEAESETRAL